MIIARLICILQSKAQWYKNDIAKHNYSDIDDFLCIIRNIVGVIFLILGTILSIIKLI